VSAGESRHGTICGHLSGAMKEAAAGYLDAKVAAETLESVFLEAVAQPPTGKQGSARNGAIARNEWVGLLAWAVGQARTSDPDATRARIEEKVRDDTPDTGRATSDEPPPEDDHVGEYVPPTAEDHSPLALEDRLLTHELAVQRVRRKARKIIAAEERGELPPFDAGTLGEILARPKPPPNRIEDLVSWEASTLITAQRKAGKTTLLLNLV
jgi:hypothetical protein